jgi:ABC-2 type transport system ATP-binding protein
MGLVHSPGLVFLDEPTTGLDPQSRANLWGHIRGLRDELGVTVFLTTHYLDEADALCDRLLVIDNGTIVAGGTPEELKRAVSGDAITLTVREPADADTALLVVKELPGAEGAASRDAAEGGVLISVRVPVGGAALPGLLRALDARGVTPEAVEVRRPTLDDVFLSLTGRSLRDAA